MDTNEYQRIYDYLKNGFIPVNLNSSHARFGFKRKCRGYEIGQDDDALYYVVKHKDGSIRRRAKVVRSQEQARAIFADIHEAKPYPHNGLNRSLQQLSKQYFWPRMTYDITEWIKQCSVCMKSKESDKTKLLQLKVSEPWELLMMKIIGPVHETAEGYKFIFTAMDYYSKWIEAFPICNKSSAEVAACLKLIFHRHGAWKSILSQENPEFLQEVNEEICKQFGGERRIKAVYHPDVMSLDQKCDTETTNIFLSLVIDHAMDWPHYIDGLLFNLRTKKHSMTKFTPFYLLHKREARIPSLIENDPVANIDHSFNLNQVAPPNYEITAARDRPAEIRTHDRLLDNLKSAHTEQLIENAVNESKRTDYKYTVGEKVLLRNNRKRPLDLCASDSVLAGPYVVTEVKPKIKIMSVKDFTQTKTVTEVTKLVPYKEVHKLAIFESPTNYPETNISTATIPIINCDEDFNGRVAEITVLSVENPTVERLVSRI